MERKTFGSYRKSRKGSSKKGSSKKGSSTKGSRKSSKKSIKQSVSKLLKLSAKKCKAGEKKLLEDDKINIGLDLDNTILNSISQAEFDNLSKSKKDSLDYIKIDDFYTFTRPGLQKFLDKLFKNFNVFVWTAGNKPYMTSILEKIIMIDPNRKLDIVLCDNTCDFTECKFGAIKDMRYLWQILKLKGYSEHNTFLIDDLPEIYENDKKHVINIKSFDVVEGKNVVLDKELEKVYKKIVDIKKKLAVSRKKLKSMTKMLSLF